ncbi:TlpA family protein disulfide reductase [Paraliobacillus sediminis]|uniref:TlpA family protein disulfide reductase n=1 Tax=Paraliobacillus sediminis TaxID=1885916 RepID=UPI000E3E24F5|nr:TlpA disulfide reductase family protein [Paraliobacillus sediminis]
MLAPNFVLPFLNKKGNYQLKDDIGSIVILTFWASWCLDCSIDLPKKEQLYRSLNNSKVKMLTINVTGRERSQSAAVGFTKEFLKQPTLMDNGTEVYNLFHCHGVPTTVLIDSTGHIYKQFSDKADFLDIVTTVGDIIPK